MSIPRAEITKALSDLLVRDVLSSRYWASEVTLNYGYPGECRVDYMAFKPENHSVSGIEHGLFSAYEVKSCGDDFKSKNGHNFLADLNYYVMTIETYKNVEKLIPHYIGVYAPMPWYRFTRPLRTLEDELEAPTEFDGDRQDGKWKMTCIKKSKRNPRFRQIACSVLLFMMLRSGRDL